ncbi:endospore germination permease [Wukongibacter baidiensis]|uniref:GerAB/ArcD/ProY family transporter n=1 Tax=Wukongibacter baidiensis TaxID=1723361 RepID=UPI003D7F843C
MNKETISDEQGIALMILFIIGTSIIYASGINAKKDIWIAIILSLLIAFPIALMYARILYIFVDKDLFKICEICFGKIIGKGIIIVYTWFFFHTGVLVLMNLNLFLGTVSLVDTPKIITMICIVILCTWIVKEGVEVLGRWSNFFKRAFIALIIGTIVFLIPEMDINNIRPVFYEGIEPVIDGAFGTFAFPFTQIVVFAIVLKNFKTKRSPYRIYIRGLLIGGILILAISLMNLLVLGIDHAASVYYPSHKSATRIEIGTVIHRIEILITAGFIIGAFVKGSIYLLAACKGVTKVVGCRDYRYIVIPISLLMINLSYFINEGLIDYFEGILEVWTYYAMPFQVFLPIIIWIISEIKKKKYQLNR